MYDDILNTGNAWKFVVLLELLAAAALEITEFVVLLEIRDACTKILNKSSIYVNCRNRHTVST